MSSLPEKKHWFIQRGAMRKGPYSKRDIAKRIQIGRITPQDLVWRAGMERPTPISETPSFEKVLQVLRGEALETTSTHTATESKVLALAETVVPEHSPSESEAPTQTDRHPHTDTQTTAKMPESQPSDPVPQPEQHFESLADSEHENTFYTNPFIATSEHTYVSRQDRQKSKQKFRKKLKFQKSFNVLLTLFIVAAGFTLFAFFNELLRPVAISVSSIHMSGSLPISSLEELRGDVSTADLAELAEVAATSPKDGLRIAVARIQGRDKSLRFFIASNLPPATPIIFILQRLSGNSPIVFKTQVLVGDHHFAIADTRQRMWPIEPLEGIAMEGHNLPAQAKKLLADSHLPKQDLRTIVEPRQLVVRRTFNF